MYEHGQSPGSGHQHPQECIQAHFQPQLTWLRRLRKLPHFIRLHLPTNLPRPTCWPALINPQPRTSFVLSHPSKSQSTWKNHFHNIQMQVCKHHVTPKRSDLFACKVVNTTYINVEPHLKQGNALHISYNPWPSATIPFRTCIGILCVRIWTGTIITSKKKDGFEHDKKRTENGSRVTYPQVAQGIPHISPVGEMSHRCALSPSKKPCRPRRVALLVMEMGFIQTFYIFFPCPPCRVLNSKPIKNHSQYWKQVAQKHFTELSKPRHAQ